MTIISRLALAAILMGAVSLPALAAQTDPGQPHATPATEAAKPSAGKTLDKPGDKPGAMTEQAGSHARVTTPAPVAGAASQAPASSKTN